MNENQLTELQNKLNYQFKSIDLLICALTHSSFANESNAQHLTGKKIYSYERLEFFGDSILSFIVSEYIYLNYPNCPEGELTKLRATVVCEDSLYKISQKLDLGKYIILGKGEENTGGRKRKSVLADVVEALLAAIFRDSGIEECKKFIMTYLKDEISMIMNKHSVDDYKSQLQHLVQQAPGELLEYELVEEIGPDHDKLFVMVAKLNRNVIGKGQGKTKREAEQKAAKEALILFGSIDKNS